LPEQPSSRLWRANGLERVRHASIEERQAAQRCALWRRESRNRERWLNVPYVALKFLTDEVAKDVQLSPPSNAKRTRLLL